MRKLYMVRGKGCIEHALHIMNYCQSFEMTTDKAYI